MRTKKRSHGVSEKWSKTRLERHKRQLRENRFPKTEKVRETKRRLVAPSKGSATKPKNAKSAIERLAANAACYTHSKCEASPSQTRGKRSGVQKYHKQKTLPDSLARCKEVNAKWRARVMEYAKPLLRKLTPMDKRTLRALLGLRAYSGPIRASDFAATRQFGLICADVVHTYWRAVPGLRWFHITLLSDGFQTLERKPALAVKLLKAKAYKEMQKLGLDALIWIDEDPMPNYPQGGEGGTFLFHVHALGFTEKEEFDLVEARQQLQKSRAWSCSLGASPTKIVEITARMGTPGWWAAYDAKPPHKAKSRILLDDGRVKLSWVKCRPQMAFRLAEGLAQIALLETLSGVGTGKVLREDIRRRLMKWHRRRWPDQRRVELHGVAAFFRRLWRLTRVVNYDRWRISGATV
jgi:hypothetical protein